ncbi:MAG: META domain-containing protein [Clostridiales bacterium]|nr:META domain-containing protein [Clostridiales bacterium]
MSIRVSSGRARRAILLTALFALVLSLVAACAGAGGPDELDGTAWQLVGWAEEATDPAAHTVTIIFDGDQAGGQAPVNSYGGTFSTGRGGAFATSEIAQTLMAGSEPAMEAEATYFRLLAEAASYEVTAERLALSNAGGDEVLVFEPLAR